MIVIAEASGAWLALPFVWVIPIVVFLGIVALVYTPFALYRNFTVPRRKRRYGGLLLAAPFVYFLMVYIGGSIAVSRRAREIQVEEYFRSTMVTLAREFLDRNPGKVRQVGGDEECVLEGFEEWLKARQATIQPPVKFRFRGGRLLDPGGIPVAYANDANLDGEIHFRGTTYRVSHWGAPVTYTFRLVLVWHPKSVQSPIIKLY